VHAESETGATLIETAIALAVLSIVAAGVLGAVTAAARVQSAPPARDQSLLAARNAIVEARAAAAFDASAVQAILTGSPSAWNDGGIALASTVEAGALVVTATSANAGIQMRYLVARESLPQGAIVDLRGRPLPP